MKLKCARDKRLCLAVSALALILDQLTKLWAHSVLLQQPGGRMRVLDGFVSFVFAWNRGAAFSVLREHPEIILVVSGALILALFAAVFFARTMQAGFRVSMSLILAGGIGNLIDRIRFGAVIDFINLEFIRFPVFNFADICVCLGGALLVLLAYMPALRREKQK